MSNDPFAVPSPDYVPEQVSYAAEPRIVDPTVLPERLHERSHAVGNRGGVAQLLVLLSGLSSVALILTALKRIGVVNDILSSNERDTDLLSRAQNADDLMQTMAGVYLIVLVAAGVSFIVWHRSIDGAARDLGHEPKIGRGWVIGMWFVPVINAFYPYRSLKDLAEKLRASLTRGLLLTWWLLFIFSGIASLRGTGDEANLEDIRTADRVLLVSSTVHVVGAVLAILVIREISAAARARLAEGAVGGS